MADRSELVAVLEQFGDKLFAGNGIVSEKVADLGLMAKELSIFNGVGGDHNGATIARVSRLSSP